MKFLPYRRGITLIEMMIVFTASTVLMGVAIGWIHQSMKLASVTRHREEHHHSLLRLSRQLRDDVNRGQSMTMLGDSDLVIALGENRSATYSIQSGHLIYKQTDKEQMISQDNFPHEVNATAHWDATELPNWISLTITRSRDANSIPDLHVRSGIGQTSRLNNLTKGKQ